MVRPRSGPSLKKLMITTLVLIATVLFYRKISSMQLDLLAKQSHNRVYYEKMYSEVSDEIADWRQRYDSEHARAEEQSKSLNKAETEAKHLREENEKLQEEVATLQEELKRKEALDVL